MIVYLHGAGGGWWRVSTQHGPERSGGFRRDHGFHTLPDIEARLAVTENVTRVIVTPANWRRVAVLPAIERVG